MQINMKSLKSKGMSFTEAVKQCKVTNNTGRSNTENRVSNIEEIGIGRLGR